MDARKTYEFWLEDSYFDEDTKAELRGIADDANEIAERFYRDLEFGTGALSCRKWNQSLYFPVSAPQRRCCPLHCGSWALPMYT